jgi:hypothetical protein
MSRGNRRPKADVERDAIRIAELVRAGKTATDAGRELGIPETTARRLAKRGLVLLPKPQSKSVAAVQPLRTPPKKSVPHPAPVEPTFRRLKTLAEHREELEQRQFFSHDLRF